MSDSHDSHGPNVPVYMTVFGALCAFTLVSFIVNAIFGIGSMTGMAIIMVVAVCKATLVCMFFMHVKYEWSRLYFLIVPVAILGVMMMIVLMPDIVLAWPQEQAPAAAAEAR
jgi:cytochrome c oxidase subunit 4